MLTTYLKLFAVAFFWGGTFVAGRWLGGHTAPVTAAFFRFAVASTILLLWLWRREGSLPRLSIQQALVVFLLGATGVFAYNLFFFEGLTSIGAGRAALIIALNPVAITFCSALLFRESLPFSRMVGVLISLVGAAIVITRGDLAVIFSDGIGRGEWLILGCVLSWSLYSLIGKRAMRGLTPLAAVCWSSLVGTLLLFIPALFQGSFAEATHLGLMAWLGIGYLGMFGTVIGFLWYFQGIQALGAGRAAIFINFVPVNGVILATLLLDEPLSLSLLAGGALVICGAWLANSPGISLFSKQKTG